MKHILLMLALMTPANAEDSTVFFRHKITDAWSVVGIMHDRVKPHSNDACVAIKDFNDGSSVEFKENLVDGEIAIWLRNNSWDVLPVEPRKERKLRVNMYDKRGALLDGANWTVYIWTKNEMVIPGVPAAFFKIMFKANRMSLIPEGEIANFHMSFDDRSVEVLNKLADCIKASQTRHSKPMKEMPSLDLPKKGESL